MVPRRMVEEEDELAHTHQRPAARETDVGGGCSRSTNKMVAPRTSDCSEAQSWRMISGITSPNPPANSGGALDLGGAGRNGRRVSFLEPLRERSGDAREMKKKVLSEKDYRRMDKFKGGVGGEENWKSWAFDFLTAPLQVLAPASTNT